MDQISEYVYSSDLEENDEIFLKEKEDKLVEQDLRKAFELFHSSLINIEYFVINKQKSSRNSYKRYLDEKLEKFKKEKNVKLKFSYIYSKVISKNKKYKRNKR